MLFQIPSQIEKITTLSDKTLKLTVSTMRELVPEDELKILQLKQQEGWMVFSPAEIKEEDVPNEPVPEFKGDKTPAQRLRSVLYIYWDKNTNKSKTFDEFYKAYLDKIIEQIKEKLE